MLSSTPRESNGFPSGFRFGLPARVSEAHWLEAFDSAPAGERSSDDAARFLAVGWPSLLASRAGDAVLDVRAPPGGGQPIDVEGAGLITAFLPEPAGRDVGHHVIRVAVHPSAGPELPLEAQRVIHANLSSQRDPELVCPQPPDLDGILGIAPLERLARGECLPRPKPDASDFDGGHGLRGAGDNWEIPGGRGPIRSWPARPLPGPAVLQCEATCRGKRALASAASTCRSARGRDPPRTARRSPSRTRQPRLTMRGSSCCSTLAEMNRSRPPSASCVSMAT